MLNRLSRKVLMKYLQNCINTKLLITFINLLQFYYMLCFVLSFDAFYYSTVQNCTVQSIYLLCSDLNRTLIYTVDQHHKWGEIKLKNKNNFCINLIHKFLYDNF